MAYLGLYETNNLSNYIILPMFNIGATKGYDIVQLKTSISQGGGFYPQCRSNVSIASVQAKQNLIIEGVTTAKKIDFINWYKSVGNNPITVNSEDKLGYVILNQKSTFAEEPSIEETEPGLWNITLSLRRIV